MSNCKICGEYNCKKHSLLLGRPVSIMQFEGSSPPEIFIGRFGYPNVYIGILSPVEHGNTQVMSYPELWYTKKLSIQSILKLRSQLIYSRRQSNIKKIQTKFLSTMQDIAMTHKSISAEFRLKKPVHLHKEQDTRVPLIRNVAPVKSVRLTENPKIDSKVNYLTNDIDIKAKDAMLELEKSNIQTSSIIKILSAGLLGLKKNRKFVPTRWAISSVDSTLSEEKIKNIKYYSQINDYLVFNDEYLGNHYEILFIPRFWSFEVIEISLKNFGIWQDYESIFRRKKYADSISGAYYANRLAVTEYLEKIKRQASVLILREIRPEYYAPLGVGILRETTRSALTRPPNKFNTLQEALQGIQTRLKISIQQFLDKSQLLESLKQSTLLNYF